ERNVGFPDRNPGFAERNEGFAARNEPSAGRKERSSAKRDRNRAKGDRAGWNCVLGRELVESPRYAVVTTNLARKPLDNLRLRSMIWANEVEVMSREHGGSRSSRRKECAMGNRAARAPPGTPTEGSSREVPGREPPGRRAPFRMSPLRSSTRFHGGVRCTST